MFVTPEDMRRIDDARRIGEGMASAFGEEVIFMADLIKSLAAEAEHKESWEARYWGLLSDFEEYRPKLLEGDGSDLPSETVVLDGVNEAWQRRCDGNWDLVGGAYQLEGSLKPNWGPYTIIYTPKEKS